MRRGLHTRYQQAIAAGQAAAAQKRVELENELVEMTGHTRPDPQWRSKNRGTAAYDLRARFCGAGLAAD